MRYLIIPFFCITSGIFLIAIMNKLGTFLPYNKVKLRIVQYLVFCGMILFPSAMNILNFDKLLSKKDNRLIAAEWVYNNIPPGSSIYQNGFSYGKVQLYPSLLSLEKEYKNEREKGGKGSILKAQIDYFLRKNIQGHEQWGYDEDSAMFTFFNENKSGLPEFIIIQESPLIGWSHISKSIERLLSTYYHLQKAFIVINISQRNNLFDQDDAFYVPFAGFRDIARPGPNFYIYKKK